MKIVTLQECLFASRVVKYNTVALQRWLLVHVQWNIDMLILPERLFAPRVMEYRHSLSPEVTFATRPMKHQHFDTPGAYWCSTCIEISIFLLFEGYFYYTCAEILTFWPSRNVFLLYVYRYINILALRTWLLPLESYSAFTTRAVKDPPKTPQKCPGALELDTQTVQLWGLKVFGPSGL